MQGRLAELRRIYLEMYPELTAYYKKLAEFAARNSLARELISEHELHVDAGGFLSEVLRLRAEAHVWIMERNHEPKFP